MTFLPPNTSTALLVVDDEPPVRRAVSRHLERAGYKVLTAAGIAEADSHLDRTAIALALCDIDLAGESGLSLIDRIQRCHPDTAVIMVTGVDDPAVAQVALDRGAYGCVIKPFERNELLINVANALRRRTLELASRATQAELERLVELRTAELRRSREELIQRLAWAADSKDPETAMHLQRMASYSELLGRRAGLSPARCELLRLAAPMHDIGKIGIPDEVLTKSGRYDDRDRAVMQQHPEIGYRILEGSESELVRLAAAVALTHHEWFDGSGYPRGLRGTEIPIEGRIVAIADVFDALTTRRRYKAAMTPDAARALMAAEKGHFDPELLRLFFEAAPDVEAIRLRFAEPEELLV